MQARLDFELSALFVICFKGSLINHKNHKITESANST